jgi:hypothetical protein
VTTERGHRLWDEMVPPPTRKIACRLTTTYAGFEGESALLEGLYQHGVSQPKVGDDLYAGEGQLTFWTHWPVAPWQDESWIAQMRRQLRANQFLRMIENRFVTSESSFIDLDKWDSCIIPQMSPIISDPSLPIFVGVDASHKHDSTALVSVTFDKETQKIRLVCHRVFQPSPDDPLDFEATIEATLKDWSSRFRIQRVLCDPWQLQSVMQRLQRAGIWVEEYPQTQSNLTDIGQGLYDLIRGRNLVLYSDAAMRLAVSRAVAVETSRGWRISKATANHKIDVVVALAMACHAAVALAVINRHRFMQSRRRDPAGLDASLETSRITASELKNVCARRKACLLTKSAFTARENSFWGRATAKGACCDEHSTAFLRSVRRSY